MAPALTWRVPVLVLLGLAPVVLVPGTLTVLLWVGVVVLAVAADWALAPSPGVLRLERRPGSPVRLGESSATTVLVTNPGTRRVRVLVRDAWPPSAGAVDNRHRLVMPGGERRAVTTTLTPTRRGERVADRVTLRVPGPLGLAARQGSRPVPGTLRVLPAFPSRKHLPSRLARLRLIDGREAVRTRGQGTEFDSLRDYVRGDDVRSIDWRATARRTDLVVRTWQPERERRVVIVLDTSRTSAARVLDQPRLDTAMDAALLLAALTHRAGDHLDLLAGDRAVRTRVPRDTVRQRGVAAVVDAFVPLQPALVEADWRTLAGAVAQTSRRRSLVVLLTSLDSAATEESLLPVLPTLTAHHRVVVASVADPALDTLRQDRDSLDAVYDAASAERTVVLRHRTAQALRNLGVTVLDEFPDDLAPRLADHYLLLKSQGLL